MDLVLIRNVMIYFEVETKKRILGRVANLLRSDATTWPWARGSGQSTSTIPDRRVRAVQSRLLSDRAAAEHTACGAGTQFMPSGRFFLPCPTSPPARPTLFQPEIRDKLVELFITATRASALSEMAGAATWLLERPVESRGHQGVLERHIRGDAAYIPGIEGIPILLPIHKFPAWTAARLSLSPVIRGRGGEGGDSHGAKTARFSRIDDPLTPALSP